MHAGSGHGVFYLNNIAIAALEGQATGMEKCRARLDVHHAMARGYFSDRQGLAFFSIHQPRLSGRVCRIAGTTVSITRWRRIRRRKFIVRPASGDRPVEIVRPDLVAVSAGFDAYRGDPCASKRMEGRTFAGWGKMCGSWEFPHFSLLEGGYSNDWGIGSGYLGG